MIDVMVGRRIPLNLQVHDGNASLKVSCILTDSFGKEFARADLPSFANGLYMNTDLEMPDVPLLVAQFFTDRPDDYEVAQEVFRSIPKPVIEEKPILGEVISVEQSSEIIIGEVVIRFSNAGQAARDDHVPRNRRQRLQNQDRVAVEHVVKARDPNAAADRLENPRR